MSPWSPLAFSILTLLSAYLPAYTDRHEFWTLGGDTIRWLGVFLYAAGAILWLWAAFVLGPRFAGHVVIKPGHTLVTSGIYRAIQHPGALGQMVNMLGWALVFRSMIGVLVAILFALLAAQVFQLEEQALRKAFGSEYETYRRRTWRLVPGIF